MSGFTSLLLSISNEIERGDLQTMKYCCEDYEIGAKRLEEISDAYDLFKELKRRNLLGPEKTDILVMLLEKAGRIDLKNKVLAQQGSTNNESEPSDTSNGRRQNSSVHESSRTESDGPVVSDIVKDSRLNDIAEDLGRDWKPLGRKLGMKNTIIDNIDREHSRVKEKSFELMSRWKKLNGNDATGQALADALIKIGRKDVAETLADVCQQDGINIDTSEGRRQNSSVRENSRTESGGLNSMQADLAPRLPMQESKR